jgi:NAD(P)-dependent dehydrogenase (short-subunit alcohol dehydrogenase family)
MKLKNKVTVITGGNSGIGFGIAMAGFDASQNRILSNISDTAEKRHENFIKKYPDFFNRVPLHMVASYLGLTRETLSRIRSNYANPEK